MDPRVPRKACHNCRPRKLRCDKSFPSCRKCIKSGQECLGYGTQFKFTDAVASRGRLAGKKIPVLSDELAAPVGYTTPAAVNTSVILADKQACASWDRTLEPTTAVNITIPRILTDPLFNDDNYMHRYYFSYYADRLCQDMMAVDLPDNPFRQLIPVTKSNPLLRYIIVASSAAHMANSLKPPTAYGSTNATTSTDHVNMEASLRARIDALAAKQQALRLLSSALQNIETVGSDIVLTAVVFFINLECIESGKHGWKAHIEGCGRLLEHLPSTAVTSEPFIECIVSDFYMYYTFASVFTRDALVLSAYPGTDQAASAIHCAADNSLICCPAEILQILLAAAQLSNEQDDGKGSMAKVTEEGVSLMSRAISFDLDVWASNIKSKNMGRQVMAIESRKNAGATFQMACCLYILYAVPSTRPFLPADAEQTFERDLAFHLTSIPSEDFNFKLTLWPSFIAGALAKTEEQQAWAMDRMQKIATFLPWGFVYTAIDTLPIIWKLTAEDGERRSWLQILKDPKVNFLLV
ncbi:fungal-specific transcription factor domain-containing protein [Dactylonectria estremocensis]|uniref:Fungal-specific transcription factor domain-containing protein n=1 Tax=Dactylonectria estremocensis TaxID=1079267 RepID=A0A9P9EFJ9_9HYPO|nr:fungal-specific transcription factor domain-containing protein [Dactylonectria estremocensis]